VNNSICEVGLVHVDIKQIYSIDSCFISFCIVDTSYKLAPALGHEPWISNNLVPRIFSDLFSAFDYVHCQIYGLTHGLFVGLIFPSDVISCSMIGRSPDGPAGASL